MSLTRGVAGTIALILTVAFASDAAAQHDVTDRRVSIRKASANPALFSDLRNDEAQSKVPNRRQRSCRQKLLMGVAIGAAVGAAYGAVITPALDEPGKVFAGTTVMGTLIGFGVAAATCRRRACG